MTDTAPELFPIDYADFLAMTRAIARQIAQGAQRPDFIVGIGRGGLVPAVYISHELQIPMLSIDHSSKVPGFADELLGKVARKSAEGARLLFVDDINDSGGTIAYIRELLGANGSEPSNIRFAVLIDNAGSRARVDHFAHTIDRASDRRWFVFPWEAVMTEDQLVAEALEVPERLA